MSEEESHVYEHQDRDREGRTAGGALAAGPAVEQLPDEVRERLSDELIDELLAGARGEEETVGPGGLLADLTRRLVERAMDAELTEHLSYEHGQSPPGDPGQGPGGRGLSVGTSANRLNARSMTGRP